MEGPDRHDREATDEASPRDSSTEVRAAPAAPGDRPRVWRGAGHGVGVLPSGPAGGPELAAPRGVGRRPARGPAVPAGRRPRRCPAAPAGYGLGPPRAQAAGGDPAAAPSRVLAAAARRLSL